MSLLVIATIAIAGLSVILLITRLRKRKYPAESVEIISLLDVVKNSSNLRGYIHHRVINSKVKFLEIQMPGRPAFILKDAESAKVILSNPEEYIKARDFGTTKALQGALKPSIVTENGQDWRRFRDVLSHPFHFDQVKNWIGDFDEIGNKMMDLWAKEGNKSIEVANWMGRFTIDVIGFTVFQTNFGALEGKQDEAAVTVAEILNGVSNPFELVAGMIEKLSGVDISRRTSANSSKLRTLFGNLVEERRKKLKEANPDQKKSIVDVMLQSDANLGHDEIVRNAIILFIAGFDTTSTALSILVYHLGLNEDIQQKARDEVRAVLNGRQFSANDLRALPYLSAIIKEGMRIEPPAALIPTRETDNDMELDGITLQKGTPVWISVFGIHHDSQSWPNPNKFDPNRFVEKSDAAIKRHPFSYMPFSMKSRACLGNQFSLVEQTVFMCSLLTRFKWTTLEYEPSRDPIISKPNKLTVQLTPL
jgi:cytochrome P450